MGLLELVLIAVGLSMDAFAISLCKGLGMKKLRLKNAAIIALFFGGFQGIMPVIGWMLGKQFESYITSFDHWIAFGLLSIIGGRMLYEVFKKNDACPRESGENLKLRELLLLAVATSIDALAVGITFAFLKTAIIPAASLIGVVTFALAFAGVCVGHEFGSRLKTKAEIAGGLALILIGVKILIEHLTA